MNTDMSTTNAKQPWEIVGTEAWRRRQEASRRLSIEARRQAHADRLVAVRRGAK